MTEATESAYLVWWNENHDWDFTGEGLYETHAKKCFSAGYASAATETDDLRAELTLMRSALQRMIYETTILSPRLDDGTHWCNISHGALNEARAALTHGEAD
jgi:hypothetical protein